MLAQRLHAVENAESATPSGAMVVHAPTSRPAQAQGAITEWVSQLSRRSPPIATVKTHVYGSTSTPLEMVMRADTNLADELPLLVPLCGSDVASDETVRRAVRWGADMGLTCVYDVANALLVDEFVKALNLKPGSARLVRETLRKAEEIAEEIAKSKAIGISGNRNAMLAVASLFFGRGPERVCQSGQLTLQASSHPQLEA